MKRTWMLVALLSLIGVVAHAAPTLPGDSVYQLAVTLTDQNGHEQPMSARRGRPQLVTMFYSSCQMVCPMIIDGMRQTHAALDEALRERIDLLAISFDPQRDDVATLATYAAKRQLASPPWTLARADAAQVRQLSALLGLQYRQLPDGEFNHSSELILLDADGRIVARTSRIGRLDREFLAKIESLLASK